MSSVCTLCFKTYNDSQSGPSMPGWISFKVSISSYFI